jgi:hypothetical protein
MYLLQYFFQHSISCGQWTDRENHGAPEQCLFLREGPSAVRGLFCGLRQIPWGLDHWFCSQRQSLKSVQSLPTRVDSPYTYILCTAQ